LSVTFGSTLRVPIIGLAKLGVV